MIVKHNDNVTFSNLDPKSLEAIEALITITKGAIRNAETRRERQDLNVKLDQLKRDRNIARRQS